MPERLFWIDINLPPRLATWMSEQGEINALHLYEQGHAESSDRSLFDLARVANATIVTKDIDFKLMLDRMGPPPRVLWIRAGNTSTRSLIALFEERFDDILHLFEAGEPLVELAP